MPMSVVVGSTVALGYGFQINGSGNNPLQATCTWSSSNPAVATINRIGDVTAVAPGTVTLTCGRAGNGVYGTSSNSVWVAPGNVITLTIVNGGTGNQTWYVRPDGGLPYVDATTTPNGQCDGKHDAPYPGTGVNQPCAMGNLRYLWSSEVGYISIGWMISGGDTVIVRQNPSGYNVGGDAGGLPGNCHGNSYACYMPSIPSGTASQHTRILGENYSSCTSDALKTKLDITYSALAAFNVKDSQFVDIACFDVSDRAPYGGGNFTNLCPGGSTDCGGNFGILQAALTASVSYTDMLIHGLTTAIHGATGVGVVANRVFIRGNYDAGIDMDDNPFNMNNISVAGGFTFTNSTIEFSGCVEEYPVVHNYPYIECRDQNTGGYGDGLGTASTSGDWVFDHDLWFANFQDGLDLLHSGMHSLSVTNSQSIANDGQAYKIGSGDDIVFRNNIAVVNCARILHTFGDEPASAIVNGVSPCRAAGDGVLFSFTDQGTYSVQDNSFTGYNATMFDLFCEGGWDYCQNAGTVFQNNVIVGYTSTIDGGGGNAPGIFYLESGSMPTYSAWAVRDHNFYYNIRYCPTPLQAGETCNTTSPQLTGQPVTPIVSATDLDNFNFMPTSSSPLIGAGIAVPAVVADITGLLRPNPPSIGAKEFTASPPLQSAQVTLTASPSISSSGETVTLSAAVATIGGVVPSGTITFSTAGATLGTGTLNSAGIATLSTSSLTAGTYTVTGSYSGDSSYAAGGSGTTFLTISSAVKKTPVVTLGLASSTIMLAQSVTLTVAVSTQGGIVPTGTISFSVGGVTVGSTALNSSGIATYVATPSVTGPLAVTASYSGDSNYSGGSSNTTSLTVNQGAKKAPVVTLGLSPSTITLAQSSTVTVAVSTQGGIVPTGTISFSVAGVTVGSAALNGSGVASYVATPSTTGSLAVTASYSGDSNYSGGSSNTTSLTVNQGTKKAPVVTLGLSPSTITLAQSSTVTVAVSTQGGVVPTGTVSFAVAGVTVGSVPLNGSGVATYVAIPSRTGSLAVTASYSGDSNYSGGSSNSVSLTVNPATKTIPAVTLGLSSSTITLAQPVTLTVSVASQGGVPTGTVSFAVAGVAVGSAPLNGSGVATYVATPSATGSLAVTASYSGDSNYAAASSHSASLTVTSAAKTTPVVTLGLSSSTITLAQPVTLTVSVATRSGVVPTGTISFSIAGVTVGSAALGGAGVASYVTTPSATGSLAVTASYSGDSNYALGNSNSASLNVNPTAATLSIAVGQPEFGFNVIPGSTRRIFATVSNGRTNQVLWTMKSGSATLSSSTGSWIDVTAPATGSSCSMPLANGAYSVTSATQFTVEATSVDDGTQKADVTFNVCNPAVQVSVVPFYRTVYARQSADIQSLVVGSVNQNVHWAITSAPRGSDGKLGDSTSRDTVFAATVPGRYQLTATSQADTSKTATAIVYVTGNVIPSQHPTTPNQTEPVDCSVDPSMTGTVYDVGPSQAFKTLASVPFPTLTAGSTVRLHNEDTSGMHPTEYHEYVQISQAGTATQPIRMCGVPDSYGNEPVIDGSNATGRSDTSGAIGGFGLLTLHTDNDTNVWPNFNGAAYIAVEGIHFRNAKSGYSYIAPNGSGGSWSANSACVRVNQGQNLAFVGNDFENCGDGVYSAWNGSNGWGSSDVNVLWEGNHLHSNGVSGSTTSHQMYLEAWGEVVQFNRMDNYTAGGLGANLKSRGLLDVIRYNYFGDGPARQMDLVDVTDAPTYMSFSGFLDGGTSSYYGTHPSDGFTADMLAAEQEAWNSHFAYGNMYQNSASLAPIHFSMDTNGGEQARKGSLFWYNNTFNETACSGCSGETFTMFDTSAGGGSYIPQVEFPTVVSFNNIVWMANPTQPAFQWNNYNAFIGVFGSNVLSAGWGSNNLTGGAGTGWNTTLNAAAYQNAGNLSQQVSGNSTIQTVSTIPFNSLSWTLLSDIAGTQVTPSAVCQMPTRFSYMPSLGYAVTRIQNADIGAADTVAEVAAQMTTLVGAQQYNSHYGNCR